MVIFCENKTVVKKNPPNRKTAKRIHIFYNEIIRWICLEQYRICGILNTMKSFVIFLEKNAQIIKNPIFNCPNAEVPGLRTFLRKWFRVFGYCFSFGFLIT
jgi:hypothetical protein